MNIKQLCVVCFGILVCAGAVAQDIVWHNPLPAHRDAVGGIGFGEIGRYNRIPDSSEGIVSDGVWRQSRHSAGITVSFATSASDIYVRYGVSGAFAMNHMPATGVSGLDLYGKLANGAEIALAGSYSFGDTCSFYFENITRSDIKSYTLYLPLYNEVTWLEIGVKSEKFHFVKAPTDSLIVVYGTSIAHGACASRPGMSFTSQLARALGCGVVNLGFSGNGQCQPAMGDLLGKIPGAWLYVIDCMPNMSSMAQDTIASRLEIVCRKILAAQPKAKIIVTDHIGWRYLDVRSDLQKNLKATQNATRQVVQTLNKEGFKGVHLLSTDDIKMEQDGFVDYIHPNDLGMRIYRDAYMLKIKEIR